MKPLILISVFIFIIIGCNNSKGKTVGNNSDSIKELISIFPIIKDSNKFINVLRQSFDLEVDESNFQKENQKITTYKKVEINGDENEYFFIEYDYIQGCQAAYPWKYQLLLNKDGKPIQSFSAIRYEFVEIFKDENPFLLTVTSTAKGNGSHQIYKISADTLENVFDGNNFKTYDANEDDFIFEPYELNIKFIDINEDGFNDFIFSGQKMIVDESILYIENLEKKTPVKYEFIFNKQSGRFVKKT